MNLRMRDAFATLLVASGMLMVGCGGGGGGSATPSGDVGSGGYQGVWTGTLATIHSEAAGPAIAIITAAGETRIITRNGYQYLAGGGDGYTCAAHAPADRPFYDRHHRETFDSWSRRLVGSSSLTVTFGAEDGNPDRFTASSRLSVPNLSLADLTGTYVSQASENCLGQATTLVLDHGTGTLTMAGGDSARVTFALPDPAANIATVSLTDLPAGAPARSPMVGTGCLIPARGRDGRTLTFGVNSESRFFCGTFTQN